MSFHWLPDVSAPKVCVHGQQENPLQEAEGGVEADDARDHSLPQLQLQPANGPFGHLWKGEGAPAQGDGLNEAVASEEHQSASEVDCQTYVVQGGCLRKGGRGDAGHDHHAGGRHELAEHHPGKVLRAPYKEAVPQVHVAQSPGVPRQEDEGRSYRGKGEEALTRWVLRVVNHLADRRWKVTKVGGKLAMVLAHPRIRELHETDQEGKQEAKKPHEGPKAEQRCCLLALEAIVEDEPVLELHAEAGVLLERLHAGAWI
mmetsp:Transcript_79596/g.234071  ORF Transcript_79596/g.234071 Transcript_79596/m.234071 type:complete len:258 (-) Transcript_79596:110-883(-)